MSANINRNFKSELNSFAQKNVVVTTTSGKEIKGVLIGMNTDDMSIILSEALVDGQQHHRIFVSGKIIGEMTLGEAPFDMQGLRNELEQVFNKSGVRYFEDTRTIVVMDRFKVTEDGVEGEGPVADRIRRIWQSYASEKKKESKKSGEESKSKNKGKPKKKKSKKSSSKSTTRKFKRED